MVMYFFLSIFASVLTKGFERNEPGIAPGGRAAVGPIAAKADERWSISAELAAVGVVSGGLTAAAPAVAAESGCGASADEVEGAVDSDDDVGVGAGKRGSRCRRRMSDVTDFPGTGLWPLLAEDEGIIGLKRDRFVKKPDSAQKYVFGSRTLSMLA